MEKTWKAILFIEEDIGFNFTVKAGSFEEAFEKIMDSWYTFKPNQSPVEVNIWAEDEVEGDPREVINSEEVAG